MIKELKRMRLQTLARALTEQDKLLVRYGPYYCTDLETIYVQDDEECIVPGIPASKAECWIAQKAGCAHESGHILFTDSSVWQKAVTHGPFFQNIVNILEDARIERAMANAYPGTLLWFRFINEYLVRFRTDWNEGPDGFLKGLCTYALTGVIPAALDQQEKDLIERCKPYADQARVAKNTAAVLDLADKVLQLAEDVYPSAVVDPTPPMPGTDSPKEVVSGPLDPRREPKNDPELTVLLGDAEAELSRLENGAERDGKRKEVAPEPDFNELENNLSVDINAGVKLLIKRPQPQPVAYQRLVGGQRNLIRHLSAEIRKTLEFKRSVPNRALKKGHLDPGALWKIGLPDPGVFYRIEEPGNVPNMAVYLLVDCSYSMTMGFSISRMDAAKQATALLHEACLELNLSHCVTGFTDLQGIWVPHFQAVKWNETDGSRIAGLYPDSDNRDGYSIRVAAEELKTRPESSKLLIVLSDGLPSAFGYDVAGTNHMEGVLDTAKAVRQTEKSGIGVVGIYFGSEEDLSEARLMYNNLIYTPNLEQLPAILGRVLKKVVVKN